MTRLLVPIPTAWKAIGVLIACVACIAVSGGCQQKFDNISESREARPIVGREFLSSQPLVALGVTTDPNYRGGVTYYSIKKLPGASGPEILDRFVLPSGTRIKIIKVLRCTNCFFMNDLEAEIHVNGSTISGRPARLVDFLRQDKTRDQIVLDEQYFTPTGQ
jgi:hypothetical protein